MAQFSCSTTRSHWRADADWTQAGLPARISVPKHVARLSQLRLSPPCQGRGYLIGEVPGLPPRFAWERGLLGLREVVTFLHLEVNNLAYADHQGGDRAGVAAAAVASWIACAARRNETAVMLAYTHGQPANASDGHSKEMAVRTDCRARSSASRPRVPGQDQRCDSGRGPHTSVISARRGWPTLARL